MRRFLLVTPLLLAACAHGQPGPAQNRPVLPPAVISSGTEVEVRTVHDDPTHSMDVTADVQTVWPLLLQAYQQLGIPVRQLDAARHVVESENFVAKRELVNGSMVDAFDCGSGISGPRALTHRITVEAISELVPADAGKTTIATRLRATASSNEGTSVNSIACTSRGRIENRIAVLVAEQLAKQ